MSKKPQKGEYLEILLRSPQTIFSTKDIALLWSEDQEHIITNRLGQYVRNKKLIRIRRGIYAKDGNYNRFELATRIYIPSYISCETVLTQEGINFQYYSTIFVASYVSREIKIDGQKILFVRMKDYVLSNTLGIEHKNGYSIATKERAALDRLYVNKEYYFDNPGGLDWDTMFELITIYHNKKMEKTVKRYFEEYKETRT